MSTQLEKLTASISTWEDITIGPHRYGGMEFTLGTQEIGHILENDTLEIPFPSAIGEQLILEGKAATHPIYPGSGWVTFCLCTPASIFQALWLLRLSWQVNVIRRYRNKWTEELRQAVENELLDLQLSPELRLLLRF